MTFDPSRVLRICHLTEHTQVLTVDTAALEQHLSQLASIQMITIKSIQELGTAPCDLLIVGATSIPDENFLGWLKKLEKSIKQQNHISPPALVISRTPLMQLQSFFPEAYAANWYFDIMHPDHLSSLPIRSANLLRIHDHLHELNRYHQELMRLNEQTNELEKQVSTWKQK